MGILIRIWKNKVTGEFADHKINEDYVTTKMVFDDDTKIIFYKFSEIVMVKSLNFENQELMDTKVGYMSPYINEHGKYCCFIDNEIVEIG